MEKLIYTVKEELGDHIDTDVMTPGKYLTAYEPEYLGSICLCDLIDDYSGKMGDGGILIAGKNFGCGSSRETAPIALKAAGTKAVIAEEFARIFYRNALNIGLPCIVCEGILDKAKVGDKLEIDLEKGEIINHTNGIKMSGTPIPKELMKQFQAGGLMEYIKKKLGKKGCNGNKDAV